MTVCNCADQKTTSKKKNASRREEKKKKKVKKRKKKKQERQKTCRRTSAAACSDAVKYGQVGPASFFFSVMYTLPFRTLCVHSPSLTGLLSITTRVCRMFSLPPRPIETTTVTSFYIGMHVSINEDGMLPAR